MKCRIGLFSLMVSLIAISIAPAGEKAYPRADLLIEPAALAKAQDGKALVILDARVRAKFDAGHIPNARWVDHAAWAKAFGHGEDAEGWSNRIGELGIGPKTEVIVYDDSMSKDSARIWWILRYWGVKDARLLNGGWKGWIAGDRPVSKETPAVTATKFVAKADSKRLATKEQLLDSLGGNKLQIVDARSEEEYCGVEKLGNKRAGAIPGARNLDWVDLLDKETHRFKSATELRKVFEEAGVSLDRPTATHCQSGGRAAVMVFGMELMGARDVSNYYPSWAEWSRDAKTPVVPGKAKDRK